MKLLGCVSVRLSVEEDKARLAITNSGDAIPSADLPHAFDRFYRSDKARTHTDDQGGTGLGLAIAKEIVDRHGGDIAVASSAQAGTTFTVTLPLAK